MAISSDGERGAGALEGGQPVSSPLEDLPRALVAERSDIALAEIRDELRQKRDI